MGLDVRLLGALEVGATATPAELGAFRQRALLALLLANAGTVLPTDRIIDALWGDPRAVRTSRARCGSTCPDCAARWSRPAPSDRRARSCSPGRPATCCRSIPPTPTPDASSRSCRRGPGPGRDDPAGAAVTLRDGLALWRGHAYEEFVYESWAQGETSRLDELRLEAIEDRIDADLALRASGELVSSCRPSCVSIPAARTPRHLVDAGPAPQRSRRRGAPRLRDLPTSASSPSPGSSRHGRSASSSSGILTDDPGLLIGDEPAVDAASPAPGGPAVRGYELRDELGRGAAGAVYRAYQPAVGREVAIKVIAPELADDPGSSAASTPRPSSWPVSSTRTSSPSTTTGASRAPPTS